MMNSITSIFGNVFGYSSLYGFWAIFQTFAIKIIVALIVLLVGKIIINQIVKITSKCLCARKADPALREFTLSVEKMLLTVLLALICIKTVGIDITPLITAIGAVGLAVSLAVKSSLANLAGGVFILIARPFTLGDTIELKGCCGTVSEIRLLHTVLNSEAGLVFIPNGDVCSSVIVNHSAACQAAATDEKHTDEKNDQGGRSEQ